MFKNRELDEDLEENRKCTKTGKHYCQTQEELVHTSGVTTNFISFQIVGNYSRARKFNLRNVESRF